MLRPVFFVLFVPACEVGGGYHHHERRSYVRVSTLSSAFLIQC